jgi:hypothetical protein
MAAIKMRMLLSVQYASVHEAMMVYSDRLHEAAFCCASSVPRARRASGPRVKIDRLVCTRPQSLVNQWLQRHSADPEGISRSVARSPTANGQGTYL